MKTAVITGAGNGLGRLIALGVAGRGFHVVLTDIDHGSATATAREIGTHAIAFHQDVADPESHRRVAEAAADIGDLALWVNNAGILRTGKTWDLSDQEITRQVEVNLLGVIWGARAAIDAMRLTGGHGHIINIASMSSLVPAPGLAVYGATKHAVLGFSTSLQGDLDHANLAIRVSAVCPDVIETAMVQKVADSEESGILFNTGTLLSANEVSCLVLSLLDNPRLLVSYPPARAALAHVCRPFPQLSLRIMKPLRTIGERNRRRRVAHDPSHHLKKDGEQP